MTDSIDIQDPRLRGLLGRLAEHPANGADPEPREGHTQAAVALVLRVADDLELLLIKRAKSVRDPWSGHVALPGGRRDPSDSILMETAIRETSEETGVDLATRGRHLGRLTELSPKQQPTSSHHGRPLRLRGSFRRRGPCQLGGGRVGTVGVDRDSARSEEWRHDDHPSCLRGLRSFLPTRWVGTPWWGLTFRILTEFLTLAETP